MRRFFFIILAFTKPLSSYFKMNKTKIDLKNLTQGQLAAFLPDWGIPAGRAREIFAWLYRTGSHDFARLTGIKREFRDRLTDHACLNRLEVAKKEQSQDGTIKYAFRLADGILIESVLIPGDGRLTLCLSSQAGCAMGCRFCLTGAMGLKRNLLPAEIVGQVMAVLEDMQENGAGQTPARALINNLVFMGMGEPLANYDNLLNGLRILMDEQGLAFTERRVSISTCGLVPKIQALGNDIKVNLAISLHGADDATRDQLMPVNRTWPLEELLAACRAFPLSKKKVILFEYILIQGVNDASRDARLLAEKLQGIPCRINLLPYNESPSLPYKCPDEKTIEEFQEILEQAGYRALIRHSRGADIKAACGQLAGQE